MKIFEILKVIQISILLFHPHSTFLKMHVDYKLFVKALLVLSVGYAVHSDNGPNGNKGNRKLVNILKVGM